MIDEYGIDQEQYYKKVLHSKLLCQNKMCSVCNKGQTCHKYIDSYGTDGKPVERVKCFCGTTACLKVF